MKRVSDEELVRLNTFYLARAHEDPLVKQILDVIHDLQALRSSCRIVLRGVAVMKDLIYEKPRTTKEDEGRDS